MEPKFRLKATKSSLYKLIQDKCSDIVALPKLKECTFMKLRNYKYWQLEFEDKNMGQFITVSLDVWMGAAYLRLKNYDLTFDKIRKLSHEDLLEYGLVEEI